MITFEEALSLFEKWRSEESPLSCFASLFGLAFKISGRIDELANDRISIVSEDDSAQFFMRFDRRLKFEYTDSFRALPDMPPEERRIVSGVGISLPTQREKVYIFELVE
jgi:hypothetical protein